MIVLEEMRRLRSRINELEKVIINQEGLCKANPDSFAYKLALNSLKANEKELNSKMARLRMQRTMEIINIRLIGSSIGKGKAPLSIIGTMLSEIQYVISSIAQSLNTGSTRRGTISDYVIDASKLSLAGLYDGSCGLLIEGNIQSVLTGEGLLTKSIDYMFELFNVDINEEELLNLAGKLGGRTIGHYKKLIDHFQASEIELNTEWIDSSGNLKSFYGNKEIFTNITLSLSQLSESEPTFIELKGALLGASLIRNTFEFVEIVNGKQIKGNVADEVAKDLSKYFGEVCLAKFKKENIFNNITGNEKTIWTLIEILPTSMNPINQ